MRIEGKAIGRGWFAIMAGAVLQPFAWLTDRMAEHGSFAAPLCWVLIITGLYGVFRLGKFTYQDENPSGSWVAFDDVPDDWESRMVWHYIEAYPGKKQQQPTTCIFSRVRFPKDQDGTGVYFALVDMPQPPSTTGVSQ